MARPFGGNRFRDRTEDEYEPMKKRLRISGILILMGLLTELGSLLWSHPTSFLAFLLLGGTLLLCGMLFFLYSLVANGLESRTIGGDQ